MKECRARLAETSSSHRSIQPPDFSGLADDLVRVWNAPGVTTRPRQQILRTLIADIIADVDDTNREVVLTIHWKGGQHSVLRVRKPKTGEHGCQTPDQAIEVMKQMATRYSHDDIAATLNRMGIRTGQTKTWNGHRVSSIRRVQGIHAFRPAEKDGQWLTMKEAAKCLNVTSHVIRRLIVDRVLPAEQVVPGAPWQIEACQIQSEDVIKAIHETKGPYRRDAQEQI
ncbi:recombinase [Sinorhizobium fredii]|uniref:Recombinase n=1 Tax=Rhizobium fredii TaxID=380 RepID=A0A2A6LN27_RHIFR|nr:recombinase [Sinorhizobium fredii]